MGSYPVVQDASVLQEDPEKLRTDLPCDYEAPALDLSSNEESSFTTVPAHPLGIKPLGNIYTADENIKNKAGLFAFLPDELITQLIEWLDPVVLLRLSCTCKALYAFSRQDDLWKTQFLR